MGRGAPDRRVERYAALLWALPTSLHKKVWALDQIVNRLLQLAIAMNRKDCHFKIRNWSGDAKVIRVQSDWKGPKP